MSDKADYEIRYDIGVVAGNLKRREIWQCLSCPKSVCNGCPVYEPEFTKWEGKKDGGK